MALLYQFPLQTRGATEAAPLRTAPRTSTLRHPLSGGSWTRDPAKLLATMEPVRTKELSMQSREATGAGHHEVMEKIKVTRAEHANVKATMQTPVRRKETITVQRPVVVARTMTVTTPVVTSKDVTVMVPVIRTRTEPTRVEGRERCTEPYKDLINVVRMGAADELIKCRSDGTPAISMQRSDADSDFDERNLDSSALSSGDDYEVVAPSQAARVSRSAADPEFDAHMEVANRQRDWATVPIGKILTEKVERTKVYYNPVVRTQSPLHFLTFHYYQQHKMAFSTTQLTEALMNITMKHTPPCTAVVDLGVWAALETAPFETRVQAQNRVKHAGSTPRPTVTETEAAFVTNNAGRTPRASLVNNCETRVQAQNRVKHAGSTPRPTVTETEAAFVTKNAGRTPRASLVNSCETWVQARIRVKHAGSTPRPTVTETEAAFVTNNAGRTPRASLVNNCETWLQAENRVKHAGSTPRPTVTETEAAFVTNNAGRTPRASLVNNCETPVEAISRVVFAGCTPRSSNR